MTLPLNLKKIRVEKKCLNLKDDSVFSMQRQVNFLSKEEKLKPAKSLWNIF